MKRGRFSPVHGSFHLDRARVKRGDGLDLRVPLGPRQVPPRERLRAVDLVRLRVEDDQLPPQPPVDIRRAVDRRAQEAKLHPHQQVGEDDPDDGGQQLRPPVTELEPGDRQVSKWGFHFAPSAHVDHDLDPGVGQPGHFRAVVRGQADVDLDDAGVDIGYRVVVEDDLAGDDQVLPHNFPRQLRAQGRHADLGRLPGVHLAGILLINLGHGIHHVGVAGLEDALLAHAFAGPRLDAQDAARGGRAYLRCLQLGLGHFQARLGLAQLSQGDAQVGRADRLHRVQLSVRLVQ